MLKSKWCRKSEMRWKRCLHTRWLGKSKWNWQFKLLHRHWRDVREWWWWLWMFGKFPNELLTSTWLWTRPRNYRCSYKSTRKKQSRAAESLTDQSFSVKHSEMVGLNMRMQSWCAKMLKKVIRGHVRSQKLKFSRMSAGFKSSSRWSHDKLTRLWGASAMTDANESQITLLRLMSHFFVAAAAAFDENNMQMSAKSSITLQPSLLPSHLAQQ